MRAKLLHRHDNAWTEEYLKHDALAQESFLQLLKPSIRQERVALIIRPICCACDRQPSGGFRGGTGRELFSPMLSGNCHLLLSSFIRWWWKGLPPNETLGNDSKLDRRRRMIGFVFVGDP